MKLISMTDFVLEQSELYKEDKLSVFDFALRVKKYAKFLKQPLKLKMFVPCVNGDPLPVFYSTKWYKSKEKVLFEGFSIINAEWCDENIIELTNNNFFINYDLDNDVFCNNVGDWLNTCSIEDLLIIANESTDTIILTQNAIKQL